MQPLKKYISTFSNVAGELMTLSYKRNRGSIPENVSRPLVRRMDDCLSELRRIQFIGSSQAAQRLPTLRG